MDPLIYSFAACFFVYSFQLYNIKQPKFFLVDLMMNFISKIDLQKFIKIERYVSLYFNIYFEYVDLNCGMDFKNQLLQKSGEYKCSSIL